MAQTTRMMVMFRPIPFILMVGFAFLAPGLQGTAISSERSRPAIHAQQPDPFSSTGGAVLEITDPQGRKTVITEKGEKIKPPAMAKGSVIMTRGDVVFIRMEEKKQPVKDGDRVELSYSVDGEVISVGTWRVSVVKGDGVVEALPFAVRGKPNIGMDALVFLQEQTEITKGTGGKDSRVPAEKPQLDSSAIYQEALKYYRGDGVPKDYRKAFELFKEAGNLGNPLAQDYMGWMYQYGEGVEKDPVEAVSWYRKAADQNNPNTKNNLGIMYLGGEGVKQNYSAANKLFREAADGGNRYGYWNLGRIYEYGWGVDKNLSTAFSHYIKAAEMGHVEAQDKVGDAYMNGTGVNKDYGKAYEWCKKAADSGFAGSYNKLGLIYLNAFGVERDYAQARTFFEKAADGGFNWGYFNLGRLYDNGWGVSRNEQKALEYYKKFGDYVSAYKEGARKGHEEAKQWLKKRNMNW